MEGDFPLFVSVIVPTVDRPSARLTVAALQRQTRPADEILVAEDVRRHGPGWNRNRAIGLARGDLIACIDDDCIPSRRWLERLVRAMQTHAADMVSGNYLEADPFLNEVRRRRGFPITEQVDPTAFIGIGGNVIYRRRCLQECRQRDGFVFNPVFGTHGSEDIDLVDRLRRRGKRLVYVPERVVHTKRMTPVKYLRHQFNRGIGIALLYKFNQRRGTHPAPDRSLLWSKPGQRGCPSKWVVIAWKKLLGPFDRRSFSSARRFGLFWAGEKSQALGFVVALLRLWPRIKKTGSMNDRGIPTPAAATEHHR